MTKRNKIIYWVATLWLSLGMVSTGLVQLLHMQDEADNFAHLGYPSYLMTLLDIWKMLGVVAILIPKFPVLKEWAYAGFFFAMSGAIASRIAMGDALPVLFPALLLLVLTVVSWYWRPAGRKMVTVQPI